MEWLKKLLQEQGVTLSDEQFEAVKKTAPEHMVPKNQYNAKAEEAEGLKAQLQQRDADIAALKKGAGENEELKKQLGELQAKHKAEGEAAAAELTQNRLNAAVEMALVTSGARNVKATKALLELDKVQLDGEQLLGLSEQIEALRSSQGFLFTSSEEGSQAPYNYQPKGGDKPNFSDEPQSMRSVIQEALASRMAKPQ